MNKKLASTATWILTILLALLFVSGALPKLQGVAGMVRRFADWGYGPGFLTLIGILEGAGGLLLLVPRTAFYGAFVLFVVMLGAIYTHLSTGIGSPFFALLAGAGAAVVGWRRRPHFLRGSGSASKSEVEV